jgi:hypothetical protein
MRCGASLTGAFAGAFSLVFLMKAGAVAYATVPKTTVPTAVPELRKAS